MVVALCGELVDGGRVVHWRLTEELSPRERIGLWKRPRRLGVGAFMSAWSENR
jgi:hypothetical protein